MGILKKVFSKDNYVNIESFEFNRKRNELRIRTRIYNNFGDDEYTKTDEIIISLKTFTESSQLDAEKCIDMKKIRRAVEDKIKLKIEKNSESQYDKKLMELEEKENAIAKYKEMIGKEKLKNMVSDFDRTLKICYEYLTIVFGGKEK